MNLVPHNYHWAINKTILWDTSDSESAYHSNLANPRTKIQLAQLGYIDNPILYKLNSHGFRTLEFAQSFDAVCFGCSFTMGTGLHETDTWPSQLTQLSSICTANLGHAGSSNDTAYRMAQHYLPLIKPKYAFWLQTDRNRIEILNDTANSSTNILANDQSNKFYHNDNAIKEWFASTTNQDLNFEKNTRAFNHLCNELNIICVNFSRDTVEHLDVARDLQHPGIKTNRAIAEKFLQSL